MDLIDFDHNLNKVQEGYMHFYSKLKESIISKIEELNLYNDEISIQVSVLSSQEAIGLQPRLLESFASRQSIRVIDLDNYNIGKMKFGITVEPESKTNELLDKNKPVIFYGVTISAAAKVLGFNNYCPYGC